MVGEHALFVCLHAATDVECEIEWLCILPSQKTEALAVSSKFPAARRLATKRENIFSSLLCEIINPLELYESLVGCVGAAVFRTHFIPLVCL
jgi:hypothetical protein